jgi:HSP20 family molecular chaperone IbpA
MSVQRRLPVQRNRLAEWLDQLRGRAPQPDGVAWDDDGETFRLRVTLTGFEAGEIEVAIAPDHVVIDASAEREQHDDGKRELRTQADLHLLLPFPETVDCDRATARIRGGVLTIRAPRAGRIPVKP